jgi:hypothetical protein
MKMNTVVRSLMGLAAAALLTVAPKPAEAISVEIQGAPASVTNGDLFSVDVVVTGIVDEIITAWDIDVAFDSTLLSNSSITFLVDPMGGVADTLFDSIFSDGLTDAYLLSLLSDAQVRALQCPGDVCASSLTLASLSFTALSDGTPNLGLVDWGLANDIKCADNVQCYPPTGVPEPGTLALVSLGLLGLALGQRRRKS